MNSGTRRGYPEQVRSGEVLQADGSGGVAFASIPTYTVDAWKNAVAAATTANITLSGAQTIDGVAVVQNDRVLVKNQTSTPTNGIYKVTTGAWERVPEANTAVELAAAAVGVNAGTTNGGTIWYCTFKSTQVVDTDPVTWVQFFGAPATTTGSGALVYAGSPTITSPTITGTIAGSPTITTPTISSGVLTTPNITQGTSSPTFTTNTYTLVLGDAGNLLLASNGATAGAVKIPTNATVAFPVGTQVHIIQTGAGQLTISATTSGTTSVLSTGATANSPKLNKQYSTATMLKTATDVWYVFGDIA